ncbi:heme exporter protein D [Thalassovita litoralis]|jgi:heme exporter protein D|uniref:Heme exporter protein D n=1 Tax=Thalassovita litoralis TaxID=1010611 RepID=A0A521DYG8_9RHOB|nr:heme exporter protein CcmD [Thalassovita litoralis]SMO76726.1 heme exporter protein D [Thalassovita litoralis]
MMPELGKYEVEVLSSYAVSILLIVALVVVSILRSRKARAALDEVEKRGRKHG